MATSGRAAYEDGGRFNCVAWASTSGALWWPVYLCNPMTMADDLHVLGHSHKDYRTERYPGIPVVYYLGTYEFEHGKAEVKEWFCPEFEHLAQEPSVPDDVLVDWCRALAEAQAIRSTGVVPYMLPSDLDNRLPPVPRLCNASEGSVVWLFTHGHPWRPCFILNPFSLVAKQGNSSHLVRLVNNAQKDPSRYYLVYTFGVHAIQLFNRSKSKAGIKLWNCPEHQGFLRGIPRPSAQGQVILHRGVDHATAFLKSGSNLDGLVLPGFNVDKNPRTHRPLIIYQPPKPKHPEPTTHSYPLRSKQSQEPTVGVTVVAPPTPQPTPAKWATRERRPIGRHTKQATKSWPSTRSASTFIALQHTHFARGRVNSIRGWARPTISSNCVRWGWDKYLTKLGTLLPSTTSWSEC
ncbi:hypothetical protein, variant [Aphanomyces astaci]|uniref:PWWP domain-containing protein n=1 Tax=Aphanomyces astaci TaxID=112090 RepID=W4H4F7_APHAT|nr:hypothetical protein, variant [Aphanomyces astaci]ETV86777.1 hypothetical protein, variant [Aphanomyces astaci]|eukprot:XP_009823576.1 hypothetical protein, variant [Aphanomyces astaci]